MGLGTLERTTREVRGRLATAERADEAGTYFLFMDIWPKRRERSGRYVIGPMSSTTTPRPK